MNAEAQAAFSHMLLTLLTSSSRPRSAAMAKHSPLCRRIEWHRDIEASRPCKSRFSEPLPGHRLSPDCGVDDAFRNHGLNAPLSQHAPSKEQSRRPTRASLCSLSCLDNWHNPWAKFKGSGEDPRGGVQSLAKREQRATRLHTRHWPAWLDRFILGSGTRFLSSWARRRAET
jgi:hypothetical protein